METELLVETFSSDWLSLINIKDLPSLVSIVFLVIISLVDSYSVSFFILGVFNLKYSVVSWVNEEFSFVSEYLEPS